MYRQSLIPATFACFSATPQGKEESDSNEVGVGKRLLERWLDQLFTALYQDLMCSVIWNAQEQHAAKTGSKVEHTIGDLLRFGYLSQRLGRKDDAVKAFQQCTSQGIGRSHDLCHKGRAWAVRLLPQGEGIGCEPYECSAKRLQDLCGREGMDCETCATREGHGCGAKSTARDLSEGELVDATTAPCVRTRVGTQWV